VQSQEFQDNCFKKFHQNQQSAFVVQIRFILMLFPAEVGLLANLQRRGSMAGRMEPRPHFTQTIKID
jgi:hypothetical protein